MKTLFSHFLISRLAIVVLALGAMGLSSKYLTIEGANGNSYENSIGQGDHTYYYHSSRNPFLDMWTVWDSLWYVTIAEDGYSNQRQPYTYMDNKGFLPGYPLVLAAVSAFPFMGHTQAAGIVISNVFLILSLIMIGKIIRSEPAVKDTVSVADVWWYTLLFPTSYYLSSVYPESLFLFLSISTFYLLQKKRFGLAVLAFGLACITKIFGVFLIIPIVIDLYRHRKVVTFLNYLSYAAVGLLPPTLYLVHMSKISGDPLAYIHVQGMFFGHSAAEPFHTLVEALQTFDPAAVWNSAFFIFGLLAFIFSYRKIPLSYTLYGMAVLLFTPATGILDGTSRYLCSLFVLPVALASILKSVEKRQYMLMAFSLIQGFAILWWVMGASFAS